MRFIVSLESNPDINLEGTLPIGQSIQRGMNEAGHNSVIVLPPENVGINKSYITVIVPVAGEIGAEKANYDLSKVLNGINAYSPYILKISQT